MTPITIATNTAGTPINVGGSPISIAITPDGNTAYVANDTYSGTVTPIATATNTVGTPIAVGHSPTGIAITPDGTTAYVANYDSGTVTPIMTATNTAGTPLILGNSPFGIAITPATSIYERTGPIVSRYRQAKCVDDSGDSATNDTPVVTWDCNGSREQNWTINHDETIRINGKCMGVQNSQKANKAKVEILRCDGGASQRWRASNGTLVNLVSNKCLDDPRLNVGYGTRLEIYAAVTAPTSSGYCPNRILRLKCHSVRHSSLRERASAAPDANYWQPGQWRSHPQLRDHRQLAAAIGYRFGWCTVVLHVCDLDA